MPKWVNELQIKNSATQYNTQTVIVRLFNTYGPGEWYHPYRSVNCNFVYKALRRLTIIVYRDYWRTSLYLEDCCRTLVNIINNFKAGEIYNIGGQGLHNIEFLADLIWDYTGADRKLITYKDSETLTTRKKIVDITKAVKDLDHKITVSLEEGVKRTVNWMKKYYE